MRIPADVGPARQQNAEQHDGTCGHAPLRHRCGKCQFGLLVDLVSLRTEAASDFGRVQAKERRIGTQKSDRVRIARQVGARPSSIASRYGSRMRRVAATSGSAQPRRCRAARNSAPTRAAPSAGPGSPSAMDIMACGSRNPALRSCCKGPPSSHRLPGELAGVAMHNPDRKGTPPGVAARRAALPQPVPLWNAQTLHCKPLLPGPGLKRGTQAGLAGSVATGGGEHRPHLTEIHAGHQGL